MRNIITRLVLFSVFVCILGVIVPLHSTQAFSFNKNFIISDRDAEDHRYLSTSGIQAFLAEKGSALAHYSAVDSDGRTKSAAEIIYSVSSTYRLNPLFFLVMGQKESGAIRSTVITGSIRDWWLGYGRCDGCSAAQAAPYKGFTNQLRSAAERIRNGYLRDLDTRGYTISGWGVGRTKRTLDGIDVTPSNKITAALYTYNPYVGAYGGGDPRWGANSAFAKLWEEWYKPQKMYHYPSGSLLQIGEVVYLIKGNKKHPFTSKGALLSNYDTDQIIPVPAVIGEQYEMGYPLHFPNYSIIQSPSGTIYLLVNGRKRGITSPEAFRQAGFNKEEIIPATWGEINALPNGELITANTKNIQGLLVQNKTNGAISYITEKNIRRDVWSKEVLTNRFTGWQLTMKDPAFINKFKNGYPMILKDGTLVKTKQGDKTIYVIGDKKKHAFTSDRVFKDYGYKKKNIISVPENVLNLHEDGKKIELKNKKTTKKKKKKDSKNNN